MLVHKFSFGADVLDYRIGCPFTWVVKNKEQVYSTGNSAQHSVTTYMEKEPEKEYIYVFIYKSLCCTHETNTVL